MPYEGNVGSYMLYGRALKAWLLNLFRKLDTYAVDNQQFDIELTTPVRWISIYITPKKEE